MLPNERTTRSEVVTLPGEIEGLVAAPGRSLARPLVDFLRAEGINVQVIGDADTAFEEAVLHRPNVVLVDDRVPPSGGIELCQRLKGNTRTHFVPTVLFQATDAPKDRLRAFAAGADAVFGPSTAADERRTRLWALLRTQALYRRQERKQKTQGSAIQERRRWIGAFVHDMQSSVGALQANFDYLAQMLGDPAASSSPETDECVRDARTIFRQVVRGLRTVQEYERFESGRIGLREEVLFLGDLAREAKEELDWLASTSGKTIEIERAAREQAVRGDRDHLREAVVSLLGFTLRQTGNRRAVIRTWSAGGASRLAVAGDGERIAAEDRARIFEPYARPSKHPPGHGLGLALAKVVVELHGGGIQVDDEPRGGSTFLVELRALGAAPPSQTVE